MSGDRRRKATALPRRSYQGMVEHNNGWVCGSARSRALAMLGAKALAISLLDGPLGRELTTSQGVKHQRNDPVMAHEVPSPTNYIDRTILYIRHRILRSYECEGV
jgi:hypothetical protein